MNSTTINADRPDQAMLSKSSDILGKIGDLETRFAHSSAEIRAAQELRYDVFYRELGAKADTRIRLSKRDHDDYDRFCDHLLVLDNSLPKEQQIVGTYRLMDDAAASNAGGFYSRSEFDLSPLIKSSKDKRLLELGRSCIAKPYRSKRTMELLWQGVWATAVRRKTGILFGCASFNGTDRNAHDRSFEWLSQNAVLPESMDCPAVASTGIALKATSAVDLSSTNEQKKAFVGLPPLLKGYLRLGAKVASHAVVDPQFGTIDVLVVLDVAKINEKYIRHYGSDASRYAA